MTTREDWRRLDSMAWIADAACRDIPTELFFPSFVDEEPEPVAVCNTCDVQAECLAYALNHYDDPHYPIGRYGIWGGLTELQRRHLMRTRKAS